jgi:hypothetical protein
MDGLQQSLAEIDAQYKARVTATPSSVGDDLISRPGQSSKDAEIIERPDT